MIISEGGIGELAKALAAAQGEMDIAKKDSVNPFFKSKYADLTSVTDAIKQPLSKHGLSYTQIQECEGDDIFLVTILMHTSGQYMGGKLKLILAKRDMQGIGSAITYARRFMLAAIVGITQDDDDGETASGRGATTKPKEEETPW